MLTTDSYSNVCTIEKAVIFQSSLAWPVLASVGVNGLNKIT